MKQFILFFVSLIPFSGNSQSWFPEGAEWYYRFIPAGIAAEGNVRITSFRDTIVNGIAGHELQVFQTLGGVDPPFSHHTEQLESLIVAELDSTILLYNTEDELFDTLYYMAAVPGDEWGFPDMMDWMDCGIESSYTVIDTGTVLIDEVPLKWLAVELHYVWSANDISYSQADTIVQRIGALHSFFYPQDECDSWNDGNIGGPLTCYFDADISYGPGLPTDLACAFLPSAISEYNEVAFSLAPNPSTGSLRINLHGPATPGGVLSVFDARGACITTTIIQSSAANLDLSTLPAGPYLVQFRSDRATHTQVWLKE